MIRVAENFEEFSRACKFKTDNLNLCHHPKAINPVCLEKKYCPRVESVAKKQKPKPEWYIDFNVYCANHEKAFQKLVASSEWIKEQEERHPDVDILKSMNIARDYWLSDAGWKRKKKTPTVHLDWNRTYKNALKQSWNQVSKTKSGAWV
jgi:hypothetical protein